MKKIKFLPLLAVGLLALVGCGSSDGQEISQGKAESLYENTVVAEFAVSQIDHRNGIDSAAYVEPTDPYYPVAVNGKLKSGTYRLVKSDIRKSNSPESRTYTIYAEFDIK